MDRRDGDEDVTELAAHDAREQGAGTPAILRVEIRQSERKKSEQPENDPAHAVPQLDTNLCIIGRATAGGCAYMTQSEDGVHEVSPMSFFPAEDPAAGDAPACDAIDLVIVPRTADIGGF